MTTLLVTRRRVPLDRIEQYGALWRAAHTCATRLGARAWLFQSQKVAGLFTEFLEHDDEQQLDDDSSLVSCLHSLHETFPAEESSTWIQANF